MNMPPISTGALRAASMPCFCGQVCPPESYYCSPSCAREDAFNALTLGKPHEPSNPPMVPLPTLPKDFFKLPPKRSLDGTDELMFTSSDHGPFQSKDRMASKPASVPRSITSSVASTAPSSKRSKWRSHYQQTQQRESLDASIDIPFFLVDEAESSKYDKSLRISAAHDIDSFGLPTTTVEPWQQPTGLTRTGSFGLASPTYLSTDGSALTPYAHTIDISTRPYQRSSSSSYNSLLTSGTSRSRSSYTSVTGPPEPSPTSSEYAASLSGSRPRLGYGSAFGGHEDKQFAVDIIQMAEDMQDSLLLAKRSSRKRSSTDATLFPKVRPAVQDVPRKEQPPTQSSVPWYLPFTPPKKANTSVPRSQWPQFGISISRSEQRFTAVVTPVPLQLHETTAFGSRPVLGTLVKKTTIAAKGRLPIGTPQQVPQRPKTPSNTLPAGINLSLQSKSFCAPAYAMSAPKIPSSTRPLHTSPSKKSLKGQQEQGRVQIPSMEVEHREPANEAFKASFELKPSWEAEESKGPNTLVVYEENLVSSTHNGSPFKLSTAPKLQRSLNLTLNLDSTSLDSTSKSTPDVTPRASPSGAQDWSPSTAGGPLTPRGTPIGSQRPMWLTSPIDKPAHNDFFRPMVIEQTIG